MSTSERLMWVSIITFVAVVLSLLTVLFFQSDAQATRTCEAKGYSAEECGWR